jgi:parallel beta-helix repeat protein
VKVTNSVFSNNVKGIDIGETPGSRSLGKINLGTAATGVNAGNNTIFGNTDAGICVFSAATGTLSAMGNNFGSMAGGTRDCRGSPTTLLTHNPGCTDGVDISQADNIDFQNCEAE